MNIMKLFIRTRIINILMLMFVLTFHLVNGQTTEHFSPADYRVTFVSTCSPNNLPQRIYTMNLDGSELARLTNTMELGHEWRPRWSPDGYRIAYISNLPLFETLDRRQRHGENGILDITKFPDTREIYYTLVARGDPVRLTYTNIGLAQIDWLSDGQLTFTTRMSDTLELKIVDMNDFVWQPYTIEIGSEITDIPKWSPDNLNVAFPSVRQGQYGLYVVSRDGSQVVNILQNMTSGKVYSFTWSPNGQQLAFTFGEPSEADLYRVNIDGGGLVRLNEQPLFAVDPIWSPDGKFIAYSDIRNIQIINTDGVKFDEVEFPYQPFAAKWLPDQSVLVFLMDDDPVSEVCPNADLVSLYWLDLACLQTPSGCTLEDAVQIPNSQMTGRDFDIIRAS